MNVLLVEPEYKRAIVPFALMKFSTYYKNKGDNVKYVKSNNLALQKEFKPDIVMITSIFSWDLKHVITAVKSALKTFPNADISVGGVAATYNWKYVYEQTGLMPIKGLVHEVEECALDYSLFPEIDYSLTFTSRGCVRKCGFCIVSHHEPEYKELADWDKQINLNTNHIIIMDNNFLACTDKHFDSVIDKLIDLGQTVDFNQSLDTRLMTDYRAKRLAQLKLRPLRFAFDSMDYKDAVVNAIGLMKKHGFPVEQIHFLILYNWKETQADAHERCRIVHDDLKCVPFAMRFNPLDTLTRDEFIGKHWTKYDAAKFKAYWNIQRISKSCKYSEFEYKKEKAVDKNQMKLW